jgi:competence protein ComEC
MDSLTPGRSPALRTSILLVAGILLSRGCGIDDPALPAALTIFLLALAALAIDLPGLPPVLRSILVSLAVVGTGMTAYAADTGFDSLLGEEALRRPCVVLGEIDGEPAVTEHSIRFSLKARAILSDGGGMQIRSTMAATVSRGTRDTSLEDIRPGARVAVRGSIDVPPDRRNPGEFDTRMYLRANGIDYQLFARGLRSVLVERTSEGAGPIRASLLVSRKFILTLTDRCIGGEEGEFLKGLLVGERSGLSRLMREAFVTTGVAHILAVSGSNVAVIASMILFVSNLLRFSRGLRAVFLALGLLWYMLLTGSQPPVVRATVTALVLLFSNLLEERGSAMNALGFSALVVLGFNTRALFDVGFQLSYTAVLSLILLYPRLTGWMHRLPGSSLVARSARGILGVGIASVAATLGTLPFTAGTFGRVSLIGVLANIVVVPASGLSVVLGVAMALSGILGSWLASVFGAANWLLLRLILLLCERAAAVPLAALQSNGFTWIEGIAYYLGLALVAGLAGGSHSRRLMLAFIAALTLAVTMDPQTAPTEGKLRVTFIDVGQGDAILVQLPGGKVVLIDAGPSSPDFDAGQRTVIPLLGRLGIHAIDLLVITHSHNDHAGGATAILRAVPVKAVVAVTTNLPKPGAVEGCQSISVRAGDLLQIDSLVRFRILSPAQERESEQVQERFANHASIVLQLCYGRTAMLLAGDAEQEEEQIMVRRFGKLLRATVLKVGHHGASTGTSEELLESVNPEIAIISVGRNNRFGHPSPAVLRRLEMRGVRLLRTDRGGAIVLESDGREVRPVRWK